MASSVKFDSGTGVITVPNAAAFQSLSTFTAECFFRLDAVSDKSYARLFDYSASNLGFALYFDNLNQWFSSTVKNVATIHSNISFTIGVVYHVALVWNGTKIQLYAGGAKATAEGNLSGGDTGNPAVDFLFGNSADTRGSKTTIDEFRLSNNARYTGAYVVPSAPFTSDGNTIEIIHFDEGTGTTTTGTAGNVGTLSGSPLPTWEADIVPVATLKPRSMLLGAG